MTPSRIIFDQMLRRFFLILIPLAGVAALMLLLLYRIQVAATNEVISASERQGAELASQAVAARLSSVRADLLYLANQPVLRDWVGADSPATRRRLQQNFLAFATQKRTYDQVRLISPRGREVVRVNWNRGHPSIVPPDHLQTKAGRYYVHDTLRLPHGGVYMSPFDLNVEHGKIETPIKPMIRVGTPVVTRAGRVRGALVLNYLGRSLLDRIRALSRQTYGEVWLLNSRGYWLLGSSPRQEWGFMDPKRATFDLGHSNPRAWEAIQKQGAKGQFIVNGEMFTFRKLSPGAMLADGAVYSGGRLVAPAEWVMVAHVPAAVLGAAASRLGRDLGTIYAVLVALFAAVAAMISYLGVHRQEARQAMARAQARYEELVNNLNVGVYRNTPEDRFVQVNPAMIQIFGAASGEQLMGVKVSELYCRAEDRQAFVAKLSRDGSVEDEEIQVKRLDGKAFWASVTAVKRTGPDGSTYFDGVLTDITARKEAELALRQSEERMRLLLESAPDSVVIVDKDGRIVLANAQTAEQFGYSRAELIGREVEILVPERYRNAHRLHREGYTKRAQARPTGMRSALVGLRKDGTEFPAEVNLNPMEVGDQRYVIAIVRDVTASKEAENQIRDLNDDLTRRNSELRSLNADLEAFSYSVSHDLRAPLRSIDGFSRILEEEYAARIDDEGRGYLKRVRRAAQRMSDLIDDLINLARVTRAELTPSAVDLSALAREIGAALQLQEPERTVRFDVAPGLVARADPRLLRVALENLLGNAWKFTARRRDAQVEVGRDGTNGETAFFVRDNGVGFDPAYAGKLFGAFQRLHDAGEFPGTGIGLATVQRVVSKHGGKVWANGAIDGGAAFYFTLARETADGPEDHIAG
jgi:PAS domain S-box-containing protein